jgi:hypothetical protein
VKHPGTGEDDGATGVIFSKTIPILRIFDIVKAREFYVDYSVSRSTGSIASARTHRYICHEEFDTTEFDTLCSGAVVPIHITGKSVFHITEFDDGRYHLTGTQIGRFTATDAGVTYTGRFTIWFGENSNSNSFNGTFTFSATGKGSDGSSLRLQGVAHFTVNANGDVTSEFERFTADCG